MGPSDTQPPRFRARSKAIFDGRLSDGAARLYLALDDVARESGVLDTARWILADKLGCTVRSIARHLDALREAGYLTTARGADSNQIRLAWTGEPARKPRHRRGQKCPIQRDNSVRVEGTILSDSAPGIKEASLQAPIVPHDAIEHAERLLAADRAAEEAPVSQLPIGRCQSCAGRGWLLTAALGRTECGVCRGRKAA